MDSQERGFDASRAEVFEAIGHPTRIKILQALDDSPLGFSELKKAVGIESSGHLSFHLGKLERLVLTDARGEYRLTGEGKEALAMVHRVRERGSGKRLEFPRVASWKAVFAVFVVATLVFASIVAVQQIEITGLSSPRPGTVVLDGKTFAYAVIPLESLTAGKNSTVVFDGVAFTLADLPSNLTGYSFNVVGWPVFNSTSGSPQTSNGTILLMTVPLGLGVLVRFADGTTEHAPGPSIWTIGPGSVSLKGTEVGSQLIVGPWFSDHLKPQAGVLENSTAITLYVST